MDRTSHDFGPKSVALEIATFYSDLYMRRAFLSSILPFKPDAILFLGDYFDGGNIKDNTTSFTWSFVDGLSTGGRTNPRVLLTHIPLYRPDWTPCGPHRSSEIINQRISRSAYDQRILYQNYVTKESAEHILDSIQPVLVLSGHDHEQCTVNHETKHGTVKEHTLGTVSWQQGNFYPSFMLLSVGNFTHANGSSQEPVILTQLCFLPTQLFIYI
uniref:Calcineurin-like phosphoesterase domain-containing protein n=1 Tax=Chenopodium quinoa TaxID=63459 RepID=A0A803M9L7_CHEQI